MRSMPGIWRSIKNWGIRESFGVWFLVSRPPRGSRRRGGRRHVVHSEQALVHRLAQVRHHHEAVDAHILGDRAQSPGALAEKGPISGVERSLPQLELNAQL